MFFHCVCNRVKTWERWGGAETWFNCNHTFVLGGVIEAENGSFWSYLQFNQIGFFLGVHGMKKKHISFQLLLTIGPV